MGQDYCPACAGSGDWFTGILVMIQDATVHVGILLMELHIPASRSLKDKRRVVKSLTDRLRSRLRVSVAEVGALDTWQRSICGVSMISNDGSVIDACFQQALALVEQYHEIQLLDSQIEML